MKKLTHHRFTYYGFLFLILIGVSALTSTELDRPERHVREALMDRTVRPSGEGPRVVIPVPLGRAPAGMKPAEGPVCSSVEYPGRGRSRLTTDERARLERAFATARSELLEWLVANRASFAPVTWAAMRTQIQSLTMRAPTSEEDPDLGWRGIGVWARESSGDPVLRLGPGFATLVERDPARARFELIRLAALGWAPCELSRLERHQPWGAYLKCMGIQESDKGCGVGDYSEAGWAVSSAVATMVAKTSGLAMGCTLPAFADPARAACPQALLKQEDSHDSRQPQPRAHARND